jgi:hypothetical protein
MSNDQFRASASFFSIVYYHVIGCANGYTVVLPGKCVFVGYRLMWLSCVRYIS